MRSKLTLAIIALLLVLGSCKKDEHLPPVNNNPLPVAAKFTVANTLQSNMVIQRNKPLKVWGTVTASSTVIINTSWAIGQVTTIADASGTWSASINVGVANASAQTITVSVSGYKPITLKNILIGDVWICSGQSNMVMQVDSILPFQGVTNYKTEIAAANYPNIRALTLNSDYEADPVDTLTKAAPWVVCSPQTAGDISGVAYYFARKLNIDLDVPIGIIVSAVDGTSCEAWTNQAAFQANPYLLGKYANINSGTQLYNGMISPLKNLSITGFIWYQGENNKTDSPISDYTLLNSALIVGWRNIFGQGNLPFYFVQMPPFAQDYFSTNPVGGNPTLDTYAKFREAQANVLNVANTGMAVTMDVGVPSNQHPPDKKPVGERLALLAENNTYNRNVQCYGPRFSSYAVNGNTATISFKNATGLNSINQPLNQYFFIAGSDQSFVRATAQIVNDQVVLTAPANFTKSIVAIRYAFTEAPVTNLQNSAALPMEPFRTDNWVY